MKRHPKDQKPDELIVKNPAFGRHSAKFDRAGFDG